MKTLPDYYLKAPRSAWELSTSKTGAAPIYRKELAYPGHFVKTKPGSDRPEFELAVDESLIDSWVGTFNRMKANGIDVPMPIGHTTDPERRRGTVVDLRKEDNPNRPGGVSLYAYCEFSDEDLAKQLKNSNVSLFMPASFEDGKGRRYIRPIRHVAITDYPVIPGLEPFQEVAASFEMSLAEEENSSMDSLTELAKEMKLEVPKDASPDEVKALILDAWFAGEEDPEETEEESDSEGEDEDFGFVSPDEEDDDLTEVPDEEEDEGKPPAMSLQTPIAASFIRREIETRKTRIQGLVSSRRINKAAADKLATEYCTTDQVGVALSLEQMGEEYGDNFDRVFAALSLLPENSVGSVGEKTGPQNRSNEISPIVRDAERRAKSGR